MKHFLILGTIALTMGFCLSSCSSDDDDNSPYIPPKADRTVVVYISGENNLTDFVQDDIDEMKTGIQGLSSNNNLVVYVDRCSNTEPPFIIRITGDAQQPVDTLYKYPADKYSSDPAVMRDVLERIVNMCPANDYGLVLWGHGSGWVIETDTIATEETKGARRAYGVDNGNNSRNQTNNMARWMNVPTLARTLEQTGTPWKFIFFDCCSMMNAEVAYELRKTTSYLIGSPSETPGKGAPYTTVVKDLFIKDEAALCRAVCDDYHAQVDGHGGHLPIAAVKTSAMPALASATSAVLPLVDEWLRAHPELQGVTYYYAYINKEYEKVMYDMKDIMSLALTDHATAYDGWQTAFDQAVIYALTSNVWQANYVSYQDMSTFDVARQGCISMFFPMDKYNDVNIKHRYNELIPQLAWYHVVGWDALGW